MIMKFRKKDFTVTLYSRQKGRLNRMICFKGERIGFVTYMGSDNDYGRSNRKHREADRRSHNMLLASPHLEEEEKMRPWIEKQNAFTDKDIYYIEWYFRDHFTYHETLESVHEEIRNVDMTKVMEYYNSQVSG